MIFFCYDDYKVGVMKGDGFVDVTELARRLPHRDNLDLMGAIIGKFDLIKADLQRKVETGETLPLAKVKIRAPMPRPRQIICMAVNYMENGTREVAAPIDAFHKTPSAIIGPDEILSPGDIPMICYEAEAELAFIIGKRAINVDESSALDHVFGYMNFIDGSARGLGNPNNFFFQVKSRDRSAPIGPYIVTADEIPDPQNRSVRLWVNGELRQDFNTSDMAFSIAKCIAWLSSVQTLEPGDIVATGTNHLGLSAIQDGDVIELENQGLGKLCVRFEDALKRTWEPGSRSEGIKRMKAEGKQTRPQGIPAKQLTGKYAPVALDQ